MNPLSRYFSYLALFASVIFGSAGQLLLKWSVSGAHSLDWLFLLKLGGSLAVYALGTVNWLLALRSLKLSVAYPLTSLNYVVILVGSVFIFKETITWWQLGGVALIFTGVLSIALAHTEEKVPAPSLGRPAPNTGQE